MSTNLLFGTLSLLFLVKGVLSHGFRVCLVALHVALKKSMVKSWISLISFFKQV